MQRTFRKKVFFSFLTVFLAFTLLIYPLFYLFSTKIASAEWAQFVTEFSSAFLIFILLLLLTFLLLAFLVIHYLTRPVTTLIKKVKEYEGGGEGAAFLLDKQLPNDEFGHLAETIGSLTEKVQHQIQTLLQERNEKAALLESLGEGVVVLDKEDKITYLNRIAEAFLDIKKEDMLEKTFSLAGKPEYAKLIEEAKIKGKSFSLIKSVKKPRRYLDVIVIPRQEGGFILVLQDKTSLHQVIEKGRDFIAYASHELRTPITIIRGFAETLYDHPELTKEVTLEITKKIVSNCHRMNTLVKNLLTLAALDEGLPSSRLQACDLSDIVEKAKQTITTVYPTAKIVIEIEGKEKPWFRADGELLYQAILNLLDNAAKYSPPPADILVTLKKQEGETMLAIKDKGIGIPHEEIDRIFERFYAVNKSHSRSLGGSGLGLSIVESIIEKHNGKIVVDSEVGKGTTFTITFPANPII